MSATAWAAATSAVSAFLLLGGTLALSSAIARLPEDYLVREPPADGARHVLQRLAGVLLIVAGIVMLVVPGPGVVSILVGLIVLDVPWLRRHLVAIASRPRVVSALNAARHRLHRPPLIAPERAPVSPARLHPSGAAVRRARASRAERHRRPRD